jgi:hypothetical protein
MKSDFYNRNLFRAYPLQLGATVPNAAIADFGCWLLGLSNVAQHRNFFLRYIRRVDATVEFIFGNDTVEADDRYLVFTFDVNDRKYETEFAIDSAITTASLLDSGVVSMYQPRDDFVCGQQPLFEGYMVLGDLSAVVEMLDNVESAGVALLEFAAGTCPVELSTVVNESDFQLRVVGVANKDRTRHIQPNGCREPCWTHDVADIYVVDSCLGDELIFADGYNVSVAQTTVTNTVLFTAAVGSGLGQQSEDIKLFPAEEPPTGFTTLSGGLRCCEVVRSINGTGGPIFQIKEGNGVRITTYPNLNRIVVDMNFHDLAACPELPDPENVECIPPSEDPCDCGPENMDDFECPPDISEPTSTAEPPSTIEEPTSVEPGTGSWVIAICNSNNVTDDDFEVRLNDNVLGYLDLLVPLGSTSCKGVIFSTDPTVPSTIADQLEPYSEIPMLVCNCNNVAVVPFNTEFFKSGLNELYLRNLFNNGSGNFGTIIVAKIVKNMTDASWVVDRVEFASVYNGGSGYDLRVHFDHTW